MGGPLAGYYRYWGKAKATDADGPACHLLPYHCLDVAAVGDVLLYQQKELAASLAEFLQTTVEALSHWLSFLLAIHDVGKFSDGFQFLRPDLMRALQGRDTTVGYEERHDTLGYRFASGTRERPAALVELLRGPDPHEGDPADQRDMLTPWINASAGHHGRPPQLQSYARPLSRQFPVGVTEDATAFLDDVRALFLPEGPSRDFFDYDHLKPFKRVSWLVAGLTVAADWIGSNERWFRYRSDPMPLARYWHDLALPQAGKAVAECGLLAAAPAIWSGVRSLFPHIESTTPLQQLAEGIELSNYPQLFVVEEVTGGGKTEAALALAHRLMVKRVADGIYLALPTMATANAMHNRVEEVFRRFFAEGTSPQLVLAHSASRMTLALEEKNVEGPRDASGEDIASQQCAEWLADNRKKALLAHVGVGTIDQALLAVLAARHQSMRLLGLCRKVLIVDEVHACDSYVHRLLCTLLQFHSALGGSAILLSATLPARMREDLVRAFGGPLGVAAVSAPSQAYPLVTHVTADGLRDYAFAARDTACRRVNVRPFYSRDEVNEFLAGAQDAGECGCWVRNTVDDAIDAYRYWADLLGEERVILFHARFALVDRLKLESRILDLFGPQSTGRQRRGRILIATQVVEQSLDLDFDAMVTDLAPIDLVIQRAGRLRRHARDLYGNRVEGQELRASPEICIFLPDLIDEPGTRWFADLFPKAAYVYPHLGQLWLSARWLCKHRSFAMPEDARAMIEAVYGEAAQTEIPQGLLAASRRAEGDGKAMSAQGRLNSLGLDDGYEATTSHWQDDAYAPTRLGEPTVTVRLAKWTHERLTPWADGDPRHAWQLSQLTVHRARIAGESSEISEAALTAAKETMADKGKYCVVLPLKPSTGSWVGTAVNGKGEEIQVSYDKRFGLQYLGGDST